MSRKVLGSQAKRDKAQELLRRLGLTFTELSRKLGIHKSLPGKWFREDNPEPIPDHHLIRMAEMAGEDVSYLLPSPDAEGRDDETRQKLIIAEWLREQSERLRGEAVTQPDVTADDDAGTSKRRKKRKGGGDNGADPESA